MVTLDDFKKSDSKTNPEIMTITTVTEKPTESIKDKVVTTADNLVDDAKKGVEKVTHTMKSKTPDFLDSLSAHKPMLQVLAAVSAFGIIYLTFND